LASELVVMVSPGFASKPVAFMFSVLGLKSGSYSLVI
jgi:hypothetical protein